MTINLLPAEDPRTKVHVTLPYKYKNGRVKDVEFFLPKMDYIDREVMDDYRTWVRTTRAERTAARSAAFDKIKAGEKEVEIPEELKSIETMSNLVARLIPEVWEKYLAEQPNGVKVQLFNEWTAQSQVSVGESSASSTSSENQE